MNIDLHFLAFFALLMTFMSLWIRKSPWIWGSFLTISYILALQSGIAKPFSLIPIATLFLIHLMLKRSIPASTRWILIAFATVISIALLFHLIPGFSNYHNKAGHFWINFDTPFIGLFILALQLPLINSSREAFSLSYKVVPLTLLAVSLILFLGHYLGTLKWEFNWPVHFSLRLVSNLFFGIIPQEAFFRGFVQKELSNWLGTSFKGNILSVILSALFFTLCSTYWITTLIPLSFIFLAGLIYGALFQYTRAIESSIFSNFIFHLLNLALGLSV